MKSLFAKILLWFWFTLAVTVVGSAFISALNVNQNASDERAPVARLVRFQLEEARSAYEIGGRPGLQAFLDTLNRVYDARGILTDETGRDLLTNEDRSDLVRRARRPYFFQIFRTGDAMVARAADDGQYWFFFIVPRVRVGSWFLLPEHVFVMAAGVLLCYWLALYLTSPVRKLEKAVERFGRGDLSARVGSNRSDELGQLARTFDRMAGRIGTLLTAERRLLLDISHELRSPLARLGVAVELARSGDDAHSALNRIQKESDRLNALVGQLLQVTRAEGDPSSLRRAPLRLDELVRQLVDDSSIEAAAHGCELKYEKREPVTVAGDAELLRRAVENVIRNAIRHAPRETAVEISVARDNGNAVVGVRDQGSGVPEEALPRLFDAFYRVEGDRDRASGGTGLGLSIARRAMELHKGSIRARNAQPGLEVEMELPVA
jgi:two-component system sensor histidine kinase CpxA